MIAGYHRKSFAFVVPGLILQIACALVAVFPTPTPASVKVTLGLASLAGYALFTIGTCYYAVAKGYHSLWGTFAGLLSCFGLLMVAILPDKSGVVPESMTPSPNIDVSARRLGSDGDPIRQLLFACQSMTELLKYAKLDGSPGPFQTISEAAKLAGEGRKEEAKTLLHGILDFPDLESRQILWVWSALRELGEQPDPKSAEEVLGAVIEVPLQGAYDTLAAYQDGSARYLNYSGAAIVWDTPDAAIKELCQAFLDSTITDSSRAMPRTSVSLPKAGGQITLLTRSVMRAASDPGEPVVKAGFALMTELVRRTKDSKD